MIYKFELAKLLQKEIKTDVLNKRPNFKNILISKNEYIKCER